MIRKEMTKRGRNYQQSEKKWMCKEGKRLWTVNDAKRGKRR
jgi:hypothetical protein